MNDRVADHFELQAKACDKMGSPFTASICRIAIGLLDESTQTGSAILNWQGDPRADALALRLCGALHALVLRQADKELAAIYPPKNVSANELKTVLQAAIARHDSNIAAVLANAPQTNETARSAALLPGFLAIARQTGLPLALHEIGASAGLNLFSDRFRYRFGAAEWGDPCYPSLLEPELRGTDRPDLSGNLSIVSRRGADLAPVVITNDDDCLRLRSYIWPDQPERLARLDAAINVARNDNFSLVEQDAASFVEERLAHQKQGETFVLFHSVVWQYLPSTTKDRITAAMNKAGARATADTPVAWLSMEGLGGVEPFATVQLTIWPSGKIRTIARADFHARWTEWLA